MTCRNCGSDVPAGARFCPACGTPLSTGPGQQERKLVSVLFVDMVGSTARADGADPEDVRELHQLYFDEVRDRIERHGGLVEKFIGDAVMAVFGAPLSRADDAERAVRAALSILEGIEELNAKHDGLELSVRAAVGTGEAVIAVDAGRGDAIATGDVLNTASRLQSAAAPGSVIVDEPTHRITRHAFRFAEMPAVVAKGKKEPVPAWTVVEALEAPGARPTSSTPLVGRARELALFDQLWERAVDEGRPHLVTIIGPAGMGKTRLAREISARIERQGGLSLWGRSLPYEEQSAYRAAGQIVRDVSGIFENDAAEDARAKLASTVADLFPETEAAEATRYLSVLLALGLDKPPGDSIHLLFAMRMLIEHLAERRPVLVVFEDVHWADEPLLALIDYLVSHVRDTRVVLMALARPEFLESRSSWGGGMVAQTTLPLEPLRDADATAVVSSLLPTAYASEIERVVSAAEGNPLFLEELVASVTDRVSLEELPSTVRAAIAARVDALPTEMRAALLNASVIGQTFWRDVLVGTGDLEEVEAALDGLEARGLVQRHHQSQVAGDAEYAFKHVLIRDVAYGTLPRATRRRVHGAVATYLEAALADPADLAWVLAHHFREGGELDAAGRYLLIAAEQARDALAIDQSHDLFTRALELAATDEERREIRLRRGIAMMQLQDYARADRELKELIPELDGARAIEAMLARARATTWTEQTDETFVLAERAIELIRSQGPPDLEAVAMARLSEAHGMRGEEGDLERARELGDRALEIWPGSEHRLYLAEHYHMQANVHYWTGSYERALELSEHARDIAGLDPRSGEFLLRGVGLRGLILSSMGRYEDAIAAADVAIGIARKLGQSDDVMLNYSTLPLREVFALDEARTRTEIVNARLGPSDFNMPWINARADLVGVQLLAGEFGAIEQGFSSVWDDSVASKAWERWLVTGRLAAYRAELALEVGRFADALTWATRAVGLATIARRRKYLANARMTLGRVLTAQGEAASATAELRSAVALADELGSPLLRWQARAALSRAEREVKGGSGEADRHAQEAIDLIRAVVEGLTHEHAEGYLAAAPVVEALDLVH